MSDIKDIYERNLSLGFAETDLSSCEAFDPEGDEERRKKLQIKKGKTITAVNASSRNLESFADFEFSPSVRRKIENYNHKHRQKIMELLITALFEGKNFFTYRGFDFFITYSKKERDSGFVYQIKALDQKLDFEYKVKQPRKEKSKKAYELFKVDKHLTIQIKPEAYNYLKQISKEKLDKLRPILKKELKTEIRMKTGSRRFLTILGYDITLYYGPRYTCIEKVQKARKY